MYLNVSSCGPWIRFPATKPPISEEIKVFILIPGMFDKDRSGHINLEEFDKLYTYINQWLAVFKTYDTDQSGEIDEQELSKGI